MPQDLYFLHGFLGSSEDWDPVIAYLSEYKCYPLRYPFKLPTRGILIGYSMGGRIALSSPLPKIVISAHPGLATECEKSARLKQDEAWIHQLTTVPFSQFLKEWYAQALFASLRGHPSFPKLLERRIQQDPQILIAQLRCHSLSQQPFQIPSQTRFIHGELDISYRDMYQRLGIQSYEISGVGHAPHLEDPFATAQAIRLYLENFFLP